MHYSEACRFLARMGLCIAAILSILTYLSPPHDTLAPICLTIALAGLACSSHPVPPPK